MKTIYLVLVLVLFHIQCTSGQNRSVHRLQKIEILPKALKECSGLVELGDSLFAGINDSGNDAELIVFRTGSNNAEGIRRVSVRAASNHDWEEITSDATYLYIGDTGNNSGSRKDLCIYRIARTDVMQKSEIMSEKISFSYPEQKSFTPSNTHNFDCEAMICLGDSLYLFTKNRGNGKSDLYALPKVPGTYSAKHLDRFDAGGLITGAGYREQQLALVGYTTKEKGYHPFIWRFYPVTGNAFFKAPAKQWLFAGSYQTETILFEDDHTVLVTNEGEHGDEGGIFKVVLE